MKQGKRKTKEKQNALHYKRMNKINSLRATLNSCINYKNQSGFNYNFIKKKMCF